ncbi:Glucan endo-1,3-alpha-glucosidase agn1 [Pseudocercospora fuligena]|uniref:Glucan endo-1,3-alpha-glucosidase agn1 n=1 Tax=Pseudocercospora fuligena TaxID=685502 RepID=A0A8H6RDZ7_9PEZI|nr:Glucan endo-1,3-alpha-glucosidase agn1 [Pseudocercospora fuligena]
MNWLTIMASALLGAAYVDAKAVVAHFMMSNCYYYTSTEWTSDIQAAQDAHIDGFALNVANNPDSTTIQQIANAFTAANNMGFKLLFSFDYAGAGAWPRNQVISYIQQYSSNAAYMQYKGKPLVTTFEGTQQAGDWANIKSQTGCFFIPDWASIGASSAATAGGSVADGLFSWEAWPNGPNNMNTNGDNNYVSALNGKPYMMAVSPWFYTNVPNFGKNWLWRGDDLWFDRWNEVMSIQPEFVQIISWNDWPESHYIGPLRPKEYGAFGSGGAPYNYADGMPHDGWRALLPYWIDTYKGTTPQMKNETLSFWYRLSPKTACGTGGTSGNDAGHNQQTYAPSDIVQDRIFFDAYLSSAADAVVTIGGSNTTATWSTRPSGGSGVYHGSVPFNGRTGPVSIKIVRNGNTIVSQTGKDISTTCTNGVTNWNAYVGSAIGSIASSSTSSTSTSSSTSSTSTSSTASTTSTSKATSSTTATGTSSVTSNTSKSSTVTSTSTSSTSAATSTITVPMVFTVTQNVVCVCAPDCKCNPANAAAAATSSVSSSVTSVVVTSSSSSTKSTTASTLR